MELNEADEADEHEMLVTEQTEPLEAIQVSEPPESPEHAEHDEDTEQADTPAEGAPEKDGKPASAPEKKRKKGKSRQKRDMSTAEQQQKEDEKEPGIEIEGVVKVTLQDLTQKILNCVVGEHVTQEMPWVFVRKDTVEDNIDLHEESSDFLPIKDDIKKFPGDKLLVGYDATAEVANQFFVCVTEHAESSVLNILDKVRQEQQEKIKNAINKAVQPWKSLGSEVEVDASIITNRRRLYEIEALTTIGHLRSPIQFGDRDVNQVFDGYKMFGPPRRTINTIQRRRISTASQAALPKQDMEAQTVPGLPINAWTQYEFEVDSEQLFADPVTAQEVEEFLETMIEDVDNMAIYNSIFDLLQNDYQPLVKNAIDTKPPAAVAFKDFLTFVDVTNCKGKQVSSVTWNPLITGLVAVAYVNNVRWNPEDKETEREDDEVLESIFGSPLVLLWSFNDTINPKLILESPCEVHVLKFCPVNPNLLVGGCANGQTIMWDITNRIEKVEYEEVLTVAQKNYKLHLHEMMTWMKDIKEAVYVQPTAMSCLQFSHNNCINGIQWLPTIWKVPTDGHVLFVEENEEPSLQFITCSEDGSVQFWDLNADIAAESGLYRPSRRKGGSRTRPAALSVDVSPFRKLNRLYRPSFRINMVLYTSDTTIPIASMNYNTPNVKYEEVSGWSTPVRRQVDRVLHRPIVPEYHPEDPPPPMEMVLGSGMGTFLKIAWRGCDFNQGDSVNFEPCDYLLCASYHDGPVHTVKRSPFLKDIVLSVGGTVFALWKDALTDAPIMMKSSPLTLTSGEWSNYRPSLFYICREDGTVEVWDVLKRTRAPSMMQSLSGKNIREVNSHRLKLPHNVAALADHNGSVRSFLVPSCYQSMDPNDLENTIAYFNAEMERIQHSRQWLADWLKRNERLLRERREKIEEEARLKQEKSDQLEKARLEKKRAHEEAMARLTQTRTQQQNVWRERAEERVKRERDQYVTKALMDKKRVKISDLTKKIAPMQALEDEKESNRVKMINRKRDAEKMFIELVAVLFPETLDPTYEGLTPKEYLSQEFDKFSDLFEMQYTEIKETLTDRRRSRQMAEGDKPADASTTWMKVVLNGLERGRVMDTVLTNREFHQERFREYQRQAAALRAATVSVKPKVEELRDGEEWEEGEEGEKPAEEAAPAPKVEAAPAPTVEAPVEEEVAPVQPQAPTEALGSPNKYNDILKGTLDAKLKLW